MDGVGGGRVGGGGGWKENVEEKVGNTGFCFSSYNVFEVTMYNFTGTLCHDTM